MNYESVKIMLTENYSLTTHIYIYIYVCVCVCVCACVCVCVCVKIVSFIKNLNIVFKSLLHD